MAKELRCAKCGFVLNSKLFGIPQTGSIIEVVEPHKCLKVPLDFNAELEEKLTTEKYSDIARLDAMPFSQKLTEVRKSALLNIHTEDKRDRREELVTSIAPGNLLSRFAKDDFKDGGEMEG